MADKAVFEEHANRMQHRAAEEGKTFEGYTFKFHVSSGPFTWGTDPSGKSFTGEMTVNTAISARAVFKAIEKSKEL